MKKDRQSQKVVWQPARVEDSAGWAKRDADVVWHGFTQMSCYEDNEPVIVESAEGHELIDVNGRRYLDAISSLWVSTLGHRVPELDAALRDQLEKVSHSTMLGNGNRVTVELSEALAQVVPVTGPHFLFASDGASAVEQALKIAFQYWVNRGETKRTRYLVLEGAYHGDTVGSLSLGGGGFGTEMFDPLRFPVVRTQGYAAENWAEVAVGTLAEHASSLAAAVIEPMVQGAGGMLTTTPSAVSHFVEACQERDVLVIADEVATGFGRTGTLFASEQCTIRPDLLCLGKGITGGYLPLAVTVACDRVFESFLGEDLGPQTFYHGHSYGGNALACAVALRHLALLHERAALENVSERSHELSELLESRLGAHDAVGEIRICGLMCGVELAPSSENLRWGRRVCAASVRRGVLLRPLGDVVVVVPPLSVTSEEIHRIVEVLADAIDEVCAL